MPLPLASRHELFTRRSFNGYRHDFNRGYPVVDRAGVSVLRADGKMTGALLDMLA